MKRMRIGALCIAAALSLGAFMASSAQAGTYFRCSPQKKGEFSESGCTTKSAKPHKGKFELVEVRPCVAQKKGEYTNSSCTSKASKPHKGTFEKTKGGLYSMTTANARLANPEFGSGAVECTVGIGSGEITGPKTATARAMFTGCELEGKQCESVDLLGDGTPSGTAGVIIGNEVQGRLVDHGEKAGGFMNLEPAPGEAWEELVSAEHAPYTSEFICGEEILLRTRGSVSGVVSPVNSLSGMSTLTLGGGIGEQAGLSEVFNGTEFIPPGGAHSVVETTATIIPEVPIEVKT